MDEGIELKIHTIVGSFRIRMLDEAIERLPAYRGVIEPKEGRGRLVGALMFWSQQVMTTGEFYSFIDVDDSVWTVRGAAIHAIEIIESRESENQQTKAIGFRSSLPPPVAG